MPIQWIYYPMSEAPTETCLEIIRLFEEAIDQIESPKNNLSSDEVLGVLRPGLQELGFEVETGKKRHQTIYVPVLFGLNGKVDKAFEADAYSRTKSFVLEVEAGRAVVNNQFLKDVFQASMMHDLNYLGIAVRNHYGGGNTNSRDFDRVKVFFDTLFASDRLHLPLTGILLIGY